MSEMAELNAAIDRVVVEMGLAMPEAVKSGLSFLAIAGILVYVKVVTGLWLAEILTANIPHLFPRAG